MIEAKFINPYQGSAPKRTEQLSQYESKQLSKHSRKCYEIKAYRILKVEGEKITVPLPLVFGEGKTTTFSMGEKFNEQYHVPGNYVDLIIQYTVYQGKAPSSFRLSYAGITPQDFIPTSGEEIA